METNAQGPFRPVATAATDRGAYPETKGAYCESTPQGIEISIPILDRAALAALQSRDLSTLSPAQLRALAELRTDLFLRTAIGSTATAFDQRLQEKDDTLQGLSASLREETPTSGEWYSTREKDDTLGERLRAQEEETILDERLCAYEEQTALGGRRRAQEEKNIIGKRRPVLRQGITTLFLHLQRRCTEPQSLASLCDLTLAQSALLRTAIPQHTVPRALPRFRRCAKTIIRAVTAAPSSPVAEAKPFSWRVTHAALLLLQNPYISPLHFTATSRSYSFPTTEAERFYTETLAHWIATRQAGGGWAGVSLKEGDGREYIIGANGMTPLHTAF